MENVIRKIRRGRGGHVQANNELLQRGTRPAVNRRQAQPAKPRLDDDVPPGAGRGEERRLSLRPRRGRRRIRRRHLSEGEWPSRRAEESGQGPWPTRGIGVAARSGPGRRGRTLSSPGSAREAIVAASGRGRSARGRRREPAPKRPSAAPSTRPASVSAPRPSVATRPSVSATPTRCGRGNSTGRPRARRAGVRAVGTESGGLPTSKRRAWPLNRARADAETPRRDCAGARRRGSAGTAGSGRRGAGRARTCRAAGEAAAAAQLDPGTWESARGRS